MNQMLTGYDNRSVVYDAGKYILRRLYSKYFAEVEETYNIYQEYNLDQCGIVETEIDQNSTCLKHKKHTISYPYEWTANMFKDAVLFHLRLFEVLDRYGLTLKDALPCNIVFNNYDPVFVDFTSLVRKDKLLDEEWLVKDTSYSDPRFAVFDKMFVPFLLIPLLAMAKKDYATARTMLSERACNCNNGRPKWSDLSPNVRSFTMFIKDIIKYVLNRKPGFVLNDKQIADIFSLVSSKERSSFIDFIQRVVESITGVEVTPHKSAYLPYYEKKKEKFDFDNRSAWGDKQNNIYEILSEIKPRRVLDIGSNTGWFSILAERLGAEVVSTEVDESAIDSLYLYSKLNKVKILPLLISFDDLTREIYGAEDPDPIYQDRDFQTNPLFLSPVNRFKSEVVLSLGLFHHLILGMGKRIDEVMKVLANTTLVTLVLEFVDINDKLIQGEPSFFKNFRKYSEDNYNINITIEQGKRFFKSVQIMDSNSETRKLLVFKK